MRARFQHISLAVSFTLAAVVCSASAFAAGPVDLTQRIPALESLGRARPLEAAQQLELLRESTAPLSAQRLELLTVHGLMLALASKVEAPEAPAAMLNDWGSDAKAQGARSAVAAALLIRARGMAGSDSLQLAESTFQEAIRQRFTLERAFIAGESDRLGDAVRLGHEALTLADQQEPAWLTSRSSTSSSASSTSTMRLLWKSAAARRGVFQK